MQIFRHLFTPLGTLLLVTAASVVLMIAIAGVLVTPPTAQLSAEARTQVWTLALDPEDPIPGFLSGTVTTPSEFAGQCGEPTSQIEMIRDQNLPLSITFTALRDGNVGVVVKPAQRVPYALLHCGKRIVEISAPLTATYPASDITARAIVAHGRITLGATPRDNSESSAVLTGGAIIATSKSYPLSSGRATERSALSLGDQVRFFGNADRNSPKDADCVRNRQDPGAEAQSEIVASIEREDAVFDVVVRTCAATAMVNQLGTTDAYRISRTPSAWARLEAQPQWAAFLALIAILVNLLTALQNFVSSKNETAA